MAERQASRAEHQGAEQAAPRCNIYNCIEGATHTVDLPASSAGRASTARLCPPCYSDWESHLDFDRLRQNVDLVRARPPQPGGGMAAVERDVIEVPRDTKAKRLVEALDNIEARLMSADCDPDDTREQDWHCQLLGYVVDTIAAARGGGP